MAMQRLVYIGLQLSDDDNLPYAIGKKLLNDLQSCMSEVQDNSEAMATVREGFVYWKTKFDKLDQCSASADVGILLEEYMFTDPQREKFAQCAYNVVQIAMKIFINAARNKIFSFPRCYTNPLPAIQEAFGQKDKYDVMNELTDQICQKHGYKNTEEFMQKLGI